MQVTAHDNYKQKIQEIQAELDQAFTQLKQRKMLDHKELKRLHKRICKLYFTLTDLKYRATPYSA